MKNLFDRYNIPAPRYTSYPTVPNWSDFPNQENWIEALAKGLNSKESTWSLYLHIPFCENLCTFCGCNTSITRNHNKEKEYVDILLKEWSLYLEKLPDLQIRKLKQLHLGGGTPTFLSAQNLKFLIESLFSNCTIDKNQFEASIEVDPRHTTEEQLEELFKLGFKRISLGVQDFDNNVQRIIHRVQPYEKTLEITEKSRNIGFSSINFDLIYGLPKQNLESFQPTVEKTIHLRPDRIALYSFAKVPWIKPAQRLFKDEDLPEGSEKRKLYEMARTQFLSAGYIEVGMDHFALEQDSLAQAQKENKLHRNFMGYTDQKTDILLGLGVSSISETPTCFYQNEKVLNVYQRKILSKNLAGFRGHILSSVDQKRRSQILQFMTSFEAFLDGPEQENHVRNYLAPLIEDELVEISEGKIKMTQKGIPFLRVACMSLDEKLKKSKAQLFSQAL